MEGDARSAAGPPRRPGSELPGDVVPSPEEFAGWPRLGVLSESVSIGPILVRAERIDADVRDSLFRWAQPPGHPGLLSGPGWSGLTVDLEFLRSEREGYLALVPGAPARLMSWSEGSGLVMATHGAALLMDSEATRGIVVVARLLAPDLDLALQNVLRVAVAWRLARSGRGVLLHGAAVEHGEGCVLFLGPSGAGKTTAIGMSWPRPALADDVVVLTAPRTEESPWLAHPTPLWADPSFEARTMRISPMPVAAAVRLQQGPSAVFRLRRAASTASIIAHAPFLAPIAGAGIAPLAERLARDVAFGVLRFALDDDFWPVIEAWMSDPTARGDMSPASPAFPKESRE